MNIFVQWHKERIKCAKNYFNLTSYQLLWIAALKGVIVGYFVATYM